MDVVGEGGDVADDLVVDFPPCSSIEPDPIDAFGCQLVPDMSPDKTGVTRDQNSHVRLPGKGMRCIIRPAHAATDLEYFTSRLTSTSFPVPRSSRADSLTT